MKYSNYIVIISLVFYCLIQFNPVSAQVWNGRIVDNNPIVNYSFNAEAGDNIKVTMIRTSGNLIPFLGLRDIATGDFLQRVPANGSKVTFEQEFVVAGQYEILASRLDVEQGTTIGDYILEIEGLLVESSSLPPRLEVPAIILDTRHPVEGWVDNSTFQTYYWIYLVAGNSVQVGMTRVSGDLHAVLGLLDETQIFVARGSVNEEDMSVLDFTAPRSDWYILVATRFDLEQGTTTGRYRLSFQE